MRKRVILTTIAAFVLLVAVVAAGLNAIFTVTHVRAEFDTCSEEGRTEAETLRGRLDEFVGRSTTFLDLDDVAKVVAQYSFFRLDCIEKQYPTTVKLRISERRETFAVPAGEAGYDIYDAEGVFLRRRETLENRAGGENILLDGFSLTAAGTPASMTGEYAEAVIAAMNGFRETLTEVRANVLSVTLMRMSSDSRNDFLRIRMREGVVIDLGNPAVAPAEKAALALERYMTLSDEERIFGFITAVDGEDGTLYTDYSRNSNLG